MIIKSDEVKRPLYSLPLLRVHRKKRDDAGMLDIPIEALVNSDQVRVLFFSLPFFSS